ncbi:MAG: D-2-hydroxyacid dehydrogenase [Pseudohongiella sp.]|uniref:D-2-hydroxyacid dehydrogenase n=1 Tax=Pseudohongiella sp. TaxID=1979412 RepID=UPI00349FDF01
MSHIAVLTAPDEPDLPGLQNLPADTRVEHVRDEKTLRNALENADVLVVTDFRSDLLQRCWPENPAIRWVHATSAGVDALMFPALRSSDIPVTNARGIFNRGIAEYVLGAVLMFAKDTLGNLHYQRQRRWQHRDTALVDGQRILIVGAGSIGSTVGQLLSAVGMDVVGTARSEREVAGFRRVYAQQHLPELLPDADHVVITAPLTPDTEGLFDRKTLALMKPSACLINVGRGAIVRTDALLDALTRGALAGAALDVLEQEPLPTDHPLWQQPNVMISAHMAGDFIGWRKALGEQFMDNFKRWQAGEPLHNIVDKS